MKNRKIRFYSHLLLCFVVILCSFPSSVVRLTTRAVSAKRPGQIVYLTGHSGNQTSTIISEKSSSEPSETSNARPARQTKDRKGVTSNSPSKKKKVKRLRHSGRLLGRPNPSKCSRRPKQLSHGSHNYFLSEDSGFRGARVGWLDARNLCREQCMDLVSIETFEENMMVMKLVHQRGLKDVWTSGRLCNFKGCDAKHLQPKHINGWFWSGSGVRMAPTNSTPDGWMRNPWSHTGYIGQFLSGNSVGQPDNAEYLLNPSGVTVEACLSINNDWYHDGIAWHDAACYHKKPFICEDSDNLMRRARNLSPNIVL